MPYSGSAVLEGSYASYIGLEPPLEVSFGRPGVLSRWGKAMARLI